MTDLLIRGATVYDGSGRSPLRTDVRVAGGRIAALGPVPDGAATVIDASGLALAPGFIDFHSHADFTLPAYPEAVNSLSQGVTTEVLGNCGFSPAPISPEAARAEQLRSLSAGLGPNLAWDWSGFSEFLDALDAAQPAVNCIPLVGHNTLRIAAMGMDDRVPTGDELATMRSLLDGALVAGAWGLSSGLVYPPGVFSAPDETHDLAAVAAARGALYASHIRNEGDALLTAVEEALSVAQRTGVTVHVSHLKAAGAANYGRVTSAVDAIEAARAAGVRAHCDAYPYTAGSTYLSALLPPWAHAGGPREMVARLGSPEVRARLRAEVEGGLPGWDGLYTAAGGWDRIMVSAVQDPGLARYEGGTIAAAARREAADPFDVTFDLLVADEGATTMVAFLMDETDVRTALGYHNTVIGSDQLRVTGREARTHPRAYGTFARVLGRYARDEGVLPLKEAIRRMTGLPASILGLDSRGLLVPGRVADLVLFDPERIADRATYAEPTLLADGIDKVFLAGRVAFANGEPVAPRQGKVLRRTGG